MELERIQQALQDEGLDGWLFYDFRFSNPSRTRCSHCLPMRCIRGAGSTTSRLRANHMLW